MNDPEVTAAKDLTESDLSHESCTWILCALKVVRIFKCRTCSKTIHTTSTLNLISIQSTHLGSMSSELQCNVCNKQFSHMGSMNIHKRQHTGLKPYICMKCNKQFMTKSGLTSHSYNQHDEKSFMSRFNPGLKSNKHKFNSRKKTHKLTLCNPGKSTPISSQKKLTSINNKNKLTSGIHDETKEKGGESFKIESGSVLKKSYNTRHRTKVNRGITDCKLTSIKTRSHQAYKSDSSGVDRNLSDTSVGENQHQEVQSVEDTCMNSDDDIINKTVVIKNESFSDEGKKMDDRKLSDASVNKRVKKSGVSRLKGLKVKRFDCADCKKSYSSACKLKVHQRSHTGEKPFQCDCGKRYARSDKLRVHRRIHTGERPYSCDVCPNTYFTLNGLNAHKQFHSGVKPFTCDICSKQFPRLDKLNLHHRIHSGEKPYQCSHCSRRFSVRSTLRNHERIHTGEKPFCCKLCGKLFRQLSGNR